MTAMAQYQNPGPRDGAVESDVGRLAKQARDGDGGAFEQLVSLFHESVFRMICYRTRSHMDAEDLTQDVFVKAYNSLSALKDLNRFRPWLFRIAVNRVHDFHRKKRLLLFFGGEKGQEYLESRQTNPGQDSDPLKHVMKVELWDRIGSFVKKLSRWEREVFMLRFLDQLGIKEIAQVLGKSESTVKTHLYRAIRKFRGNPEVGSLLQGENS